MVTVMNRNPKVRISNVENSNDHDLEHDVKHDFEDSQILSTFANAI